MNRIVDLIRGQLAAYRDETDRHLLDRFLTVRDEAAFAELVRRHGPVVWGVCRRRLINQHDAEDAFQATFLVLVRRAAGITAKVPLGPWLHRVAVMTAGNVLRGNRRRAPVTGPMEHEVVAPGADSIADRLDLDAALLALPERDRAPVVLCHLQGLTRREAAEKLGCPEGTLSARLHRALARLKARLGGRDVAVLTAVVPAALSAATVHAAIIDSTSTLTAAGISPAVAGLTDGVLRMFLLKKVAAGLALAVLATGGLMAGFAIRPGIAAQATLPMASEPEAQPDDADAAAKRLEKRIAELQKQHDLYQAMLAEVVVEARKLENGRPAEGAPADDLDAARKRLAEQIDDLAKRKAALDQLSTDLNAQLAKFDAAILEKQAAAAAAELGKDIAVSVGDGNPSGYTYTVREVVNGKVAEVHTSNLDILKTYLTRAFNDPKGPKTLRVAAYKDRPYDDLKELLSACAEAGYTKASFSRSERRYSVRVVPYTSVYKTHLKVLEPTPSLSPGEIDLKKYAPKK